MTDSEINETIAELCGWKRSFSKAKNEHRWIGPGGWSWLKPMDYVNDLNACTEFEKMPGIKQQNDYAWSLRALRVGGSDDFQLATSSARQRCEAFLRMHKKWSAE